VPPVPIDMVFCWAWAAPAKARPAEIVMASMAAVFFILFILNRFLT
jgi:hypothetical protein